MLIRVALFVILIYGMTQVSYGSNVDSLLKATTTFPKDTNTVVAYQLLAESFYESDPDTAAYFAQSGMDVAYEIDWDFGVARCKARLALAKDYGGLTTEAIELYQEALSEYIRLNKPTYEAGVYTNMGVAYYYAGDYAKSIEYYDKAVQKYEVLGETKRLAPTLNNLAIIYRSLGRWDESLELYDKSIEIKKELKDTLGLANTYFNLAVAYSFLNRDTLCLQSFQKSFDLYEALGNETEKIDSQLGLAISKFRMGHLDGAEDLLVEAMSKVSGNRALRFLPIGHFYLAKLKRDDGDYASAIIELDKGMKIFEGKELTDVYYQYTELYAELFGKTGNQEKEVFYLKEYIMLTDSLWSTEKHQMIEEMQAKYQAREKQNKIDLQEAQIAEKDQERNVILLLSALLLALLGGAAYTAWNRRKTNNKLREKNTIIEKALSEKELLLKEIHHRVKNNLQVISSLLSIQSREIVDEKALEAVNESRNRVRSMAIIHQDLYQEDNLMGIEVDSYITKLCASLFNSYKVNNDQIELQTNIEKLNLDVDTIIPLGLILNELITNSLKYAFPEGRNGKIDIRLFLENERLNLTVSDNGVGMANAQLKDDSTSFGMKMIHAFAKKLEAETRIDQENGTTVGLKIKKFKLAS